MMASQSHPFLDPLWRRVLLIAVCAGWSVIEVLGGEQFWATLAIGMTVYGAWLYLIRYKPAPPKE